jgi:hypothetical protein
MKFRPSEIRGDQRITIMGQTGSGKSVISRFLLEGMRKKRWRIVIVDPKKDWMKYLGKKYEFAEGKSLGTVNNPVLVKDFNPKLAVQIFQPLEWDHTCEVFFKAVIATRNTIVYIDEITQLASAVTVPRELKIIWQQGRSLNIGAWCSTQRPKGIPVMIKDQSEIWFLFRINNIDDRKVVRGYIPLEETPEVVARPLPKFWFWFWEDSMSKPVLVKPLKIEKEKAVA